jgi:hypothetical protein
VTSDTTSHPGADDLVLHHYGESDEPERIDAHLAACAECREAFAKLQTTLAAVQPEEVPDRYRGADYGARVWERLEPRLLGQLGPAATMAAAAAAGAKMRAAVPLRPPSALRSLLWTGALAASLVAAFLLGRHLPRPDAAGTSGPVRERILLIAVGDHLERSQGVLLELLNADPQAPLDVTGEQRSAQDLLAANRIYRQAAMRTGDAGVAHVLEELERVLVEVASGPSELGPQDLAALRRRIESQGVLFRVRVTGSQIREREKVAVAKPPKTEL